MFLRRLIRRGIGLLGSFWLVSVCAHPIPDSITVRLQGFASALEQFGKAFPQEKVYLHFDNTSYYQGDPIWFQCYVVTSEFNQPRRDCFPADFTNPKRPLSGEFYVDAIAFLFRFL